MRQLKFRVWDKDFKKMHICGEDVHDSITFDSNGRAFYYNLQNGDGSYGDDSAYVLMQFTGLTDGNGKEIYEGDIVDYLCESDTSDWMERGVVEWDEELLQYNVGDKKEKLDVDVVENVWVVGNKFANPELLEVV